ncbi:potassium channel family protein [Haloarcula halophila]|uniref:potassium channel family protein n=1 Tax=Haloarcula TaxID=2237 RepID=UPI0023E3A8B0|nr:TrkA family potassium uptake protein [Halomicroarcula sp. DFY41]
MKFVIVGYGRVGSRTARILQSEGHEVSIVENNLEKADRARDAGFTVFEGDGTDESVLEDAGIETADAIGGLTGDLNTNFTACMIGKEFDCRTVLRIDADYREEIYEKYAADVDEIIYPERLGAAGAKTALLGGDFNVFADLTEKLSIASVRVPEGSPVIGTRVVELDLPGEARVYAHGRAHESMTIPLPQTEIEAGDSVAVMAAPEGLDEVRAAFGGEASA